MSESASATGVLFGRKRAMVEVPFWKPGATVARSVITALPCENITCRFSGIGLGGATVARSVTTALPAENMTCRFAGIGMRSVDVGTDVISASLDSTPGVYVVVAFSNVSFLENGRVVKEPARLATLVAAEGV